MSSWKPRKDSAEILNFAMAKIKSVPYKVSNRWVFYRVVQAGFATKAQIKIFDYLLSRARKSFYDEWKPDTLTDSIRHADFIGEFAAAFNIELDSIRDQPYYCQLWFEAEAMHEQFEHYTRDYRVSLIPFRGDCSIPIKWQLAKKLEGIYEKYAKPIQVLYFGDYDKKGLAILDAALKDIKVWCKVPFSVERIGLTLEQAKEFGLPANPDRPNSFQWEAVEDTDAKKLILDSLSKYQLPLSNGLQEREKTIKAKVRTAILEVLNSELETELE